jgi:hypothetical protein
MGKSIREKELGDALKVNWRNISLTLIRSLSAFPSVKGKVTECYSYEPSATELRDLDRPRTEPLAPE